MYRRGFRRCGGEFLSGCPERNQWPRPPSLGPSGQFTFRSTRARLRMSAPRSYSPPLDPIYGDYPLGWAKISGAQNLSGFSQFLPGHFVVADFVSLASPGPGKARSLHRSSSPTQTRYAGLCVGGRLRRPICVENCGGCGFTAAPGFAEQVFAGPLSAGRPVSGPYEKEGTLPDAP